MSEMPRREFMAAAAGLTAAATAGLMGDESRCNMDLTRREWLGVAASVGAGLLPVGCTGRPNQEAAGGHEDVLARFPGKVAMRVVNDRPPCLETPWRYFQYDFTPNEAFYVRSHLQTVPAAIDLKTWRLRIDGAVDRPLELSMRRPRAAGERRGGGSEPVLGQLPQPVWPEGPRAQMAQRGDGQRPLGGGRAGQGAAAAGVRARRRAGDLRRAGRGAARLGARFRQGPRHRPRSAT